MVKRYWWCWLLIVSLLVACEQEDTGEQEVSVPPFAPAPTAIPLPADASTAARVRARGYLVVGVRYDDEPFGSVDDQGGLVGFDVDLAHEFAFRWLGDSEAVEFVQVSNASVNERLQTGRADLIIGALPSNQGAARDMNFSAAYFYDGLSLLVRTNSSPTATATLNWPKDLDGVTVGVVEESDAEEQLFGAAGAAQPRVIYYPSYFSAVAGLESGVVRAVVGPRRTLARLAAGNSELGLTPRFTRAPYAIGLPKGDGPWRDLVNVTLMNLIADGTYASLFQKWFPRERPPELEMWTGTSRLSFDSLDDELAPAPATIQAIEGRGYLIAGLLDDQLPFGDFDANGVARGFEAELLRTLAGRWLGDVTAVQFVPHSEESGIAALKAGQIDLLAARLPHTLPRDDEVDFSLTTYQGGIGLLVSAASDVNGLADLNSKAVAVPAGGIVADAFQRATMQARVAVSVRPVDDANTALAGVADGFYHAYADWRGDLLRLAYTNPGFVVLDERLTRRPMALGLPQNDTAWRDLVDLTLQALVAEGSFAALYDDWFGTDPPFAVEIWPGTPYRALELNPLPAAAP